MPQSANLPGGLTAEQVPQFISLGWDDNGIAGWDPEKPSGLYWALEMYAARKNADGSPALASFYMTSSYVTGDYNAYGKKPDASSTHLKRLWRRTWRDGHEVGNHTHTHPHGKDPETGKVLPVSEWVAEMEKCNEVLTAPFDENESVENPDPTKGPGIPAEAIVGFRTPFLEYTNHTFAAVKNIGFTYDCSIQEGFQPSMDGTNFYWPYTLDEGSQAHDLWMEWGLKDPIEPHPGLWTIPVYTVIVPPDEECANYGVPTGLRDRMKKTLDYFETERGMIAGIDYNMWVLFQMTKAEFLATLKYTLDLRFKGNRAPFTFGMHSDIYADEYSEEDKMGTTPAERREAIEEFLDYALRKDGVRVAPAKDIIDFMQSPVPIKQVFPES